LQPFLRHPENLAAKAKVAVGFVVGLPAVDDPGFDLQLICREPLDAHSIEEPRCVRRNKGWLIGPVIEVVVAEQPDIGNENSRIDVEAVVHVEVVSAVRFRKILVSSDDVPLSNAGAGVVARRGYGKESVHVQDSAPNILPMEVAAHTELRQLKFAIPEVLGR